MHKQCYPPRKRQPAPGRPGQKGFWGRQKSLQDFVHHIPFPLSVIQLPEGRFLAANRKFWSLLEYDQNDLIGRTVCELNLWADHRRFELLEARLQKERWVQNFESQLNTRSGRTIIVQVAAECFDYQGQDHVLISLVDVTERRRIEQLLLERENILYGTGEMTRTLTDALEPPQVYERLEMTIHHLLPEVSSVSVSLYDPEEDCLKPVYGQFHYPVRVPQPVGLATLTLPVATRRGPKQAVLELQETFSGWVIPMQAKGEVIGAVQIQTRWPRPLSDANAALLTWLCNTAAVSIHSASLCEQLQQSNQNLNQAYEAILDGWSRALELRDHETQGHTDRVAELAVQLGRRLGMDNEQLENVRRGAQLHDIGKMGIPDQILFKPGPLTEEEWAVMRRHPVYAYEMLRPFPQFRDIVDIPYCHHEKWDGTGYPRGLKGKEIPLAARVFAVVDVWDALNSDRPYRPAWPRHQVLEYIYNESGRHFDPEVAAEFLNLVTELPCIEG